jgi:hypothetical protein
MRTACGERDADLDLSGQIDCVQLDSKGAAADTELVAVVEAAELSLSPEDVAHADAVDGEDMELGGARRGIDAKLGVNLGDRGYLNADVVGRVTAKGDGGLEERKRLAVGSVVVKEEQTTERGRHGELRLKTNAGERQTGAHSSI